MKVKSSSSSLKCLPNMFCVKNTTILLIVILGIIAVYFMYSKYYIAEKVNSTMQMSPMLMPPMSMPQMSMPQMSMPQMSMPQMFMQGSGNSDILENPYAPPLRNDSYYSGITMPINVRTQGPPINTNYRQVGLLTRINGKETILPLMGRPLLKNRDKWQFYTMSDKNNSVKLPISFKKKSCTGEYGCDNIYNGDTVYVEGYKDAFQATIYDNAVAEYF